ncbi:MAG TPA: alpha-hydroxy acid oxidase [Steroidobacteraceae bacterium]|nr:alpha-hydroxy acid oxidase [Steroidobacteraceae bacterium]
MPWKRRPFRWAELERAVNISDLREIARRKVPNFIFEYVEGGAEDEATLRRNRAALEALHFVPQTLVDTSARHQRIELFGRESAAPLIIAPTGGNGMLSPQGDLALARAAASRGVPFCLSTVSTVRLERVATEVGGRLWMQLYVMRDRKVAQDIVARAQAAGYEALVFTTDANVFGAREWDVRNYRRPGKPTWRNLLDALRHTRWLFEVLIRHGVPQFENFATFLPPGAASALGGSTVIPKIFAPSLTWDDIGWLRGLWPGKLLVKGVLSIADAERAAALGCDGIVLTNHGGRQLDYCVSSVDVLPEIARAVGQRLTVIVDGGFRRGSDVIKALALGARSVMIGRATLYGLTAAGERGARRALEILTGEIDRTLGQLGCCSIGDLGPLLLRTPSRPSES